MVRRIRPYLDDLIGPLQSSFIPNRGTSDNALLLKSWFMLCIEREEEGASSCSKLTLKRHMIGLIGTSYASLYPNLASQPSLLTLS